MGDRGHVHIEDTGVWLYTHWGASRLEDDVASALARRLRWMDPEYLARIIFDVMIGTQQGTETGFGIGTHQHGDTWKHIHINCEERTVTVDQPPWEGSFEEFVEKHGYVVA